jgi:hypothetical protein
MISNLGNVERRLNLYLAVPDKRFTVRSGLNPHEDAVKQRVRQYWADKDISSAKKLEGLNIDLSGFDPRRTSGRQLMEIGAFLAEQGMIDSDLAHALSNLGQETDAQGNHLNRETELNAYEYLNERIGRLSQPVFQNNGIAKNELVEANASLCVLMALEDYAKAPRERSLVNIRV